MKSKVIGGNDELVHDKMEIAVEKRVRLERPKKPLGSYFLFMKDLKEKGTKMSRDEATAYWKEMPADEKSKYVNQSLEMKKKYLEKLKAYEEVIFCFLLFLFGLRNSADFWFVAES